MATYLEETEVSRGQSAQSDDHLCADGAEVFSSWGGWGRCLPKQLRDLEMGERQKECEANKHQYINDLHLTTTHAKTDSRHRDSNIR